MLLLVTSFVMEHAMAFVSKQGEAGVVPLRISFIGNVILCAWTSPLIAESWTPLSRSQFSRPYVLYHSPLSSALILVATSLCSVFWKMPLFWTWNMIPSTKCLTYHPLFRGCCPHALWYAPCYLLPLLYLLWLPLTTLCVGVGVRVCVCVCGNSLSW